MMTQALTHSRPLDGMRKTALRLRDRSRALVRAHPRGAAGIGVLGFVGFVAVGSIAVPNPATAPEAHAAPPAPPPLILQQIAPEQAVKVNAEIPFVTGPNPAATPFVFKGKAAARTQALQCLASAVYYEAGNQDTDGERAVAQVVLNRVRHPAFPNTVCGVVYEGSTRPTGCQFTFTCDGSLARQPDADGWRRAWKVAEDALSGAVYAPVGWATHYHADYVLPTWASSMAKNAIVGAHLFYRWSGSWGQAAAFTSAYSGREPNAATLRTAALAVPHITPVYTQQGQLAKAIEEIPGAEAVKLEPSMRGDKRIAVRFNLVAREASKDVVPQDYTKTFEASDNLKYALSADPVGGNQKPLGRAPAPAPAASTSASASAGGAQAAAPQH
jgi:spore germination cell wall hydrolase CwlJ-like protein